MNEPSTVTRDEQIVLIVKVESGGVCRSCGNPVTWTRTIAGRLMPLENHLRVRALLAPELRHRRNLRIAVVPRSTMTHLVKDAKHEAKLVAQGCHVREELQEVWEIPASLTHWANCKTMAAERKGARK